MALSVITIIHIVSIVFCIIELGLTAYACSAYYHPWGGRSPDILNFMVFNSIWSLLVLLYIGITPLYLEKLFHRLAALAALAVTVIFWFSGAIALAVFIGGAWCGANTFCGSVQGAVAFGFFLWALFTALLVLEALEYQRSGSGVDPHTPHHKTQPYAGA